MDRSTSDRRCHSREPGSSGEVRRAGDKLEHPWYHRIGGYLLSTPLPRRSRSFIKLSDISRTLGFCALALTASPAAPQAQAPHTAPTHTTASPITLQNVIKTSGINFKLKNSLTPRRYSIETMAGGVAVF